MERFYTKKSKAQEIKENMQRSINTPSPHMDGEPNAPERCAIRALCDLFDEMLKMLESIGSFEKELESKTDKELLDMLTATGGAAYDKIVEILKRRGIM